MKTFYLTDPGKIRSHNEDSVTVLKNSCGEHLLVVADGMGGHRKGEVASALALSYIGKRFLETDTLGNKIDAIRWLNDTVNVVNKEILTYADNHADSKGMGTTLVVSILSKEYLIFGNLGDSSGYVINNNRLHKVTNDHTLVNLLVDAGNITKEEALNHPKKNVLMKALGVTENVEIDIFEVDVKSEGILLCSDGLTNMLSDSNIEKVLNDVEIGIEEKVIKLIRKCNARGGNDNISIALLLKEAGE